MDYKKVDQNYFLKDTLFLARDLIGKYLIREYDNTSIIMKIIETEAYIGEIDKACHAYNFNKTKRTKTMFETGGISYVYLIYGMYHCYNIVTEKEDYPAAILIRGGKIIKGMEKASINRYNKKYDELNNYQIKNFSNGPGKVCMAMGIDMEFNGIPLGDNLFIGEPINKKDYDIKTGKRINIGYAEEAQDFPWRFYIGG